MAYNAEKTIVGTFAKIWLDGDLISEATQLQAKASLDKVEVNMCGVMGKRYKVTGFDIKGTLKLNKVTSRMGLKIADNLRNGKETVCEIISELKDPAAYGAERVRLINVKFDELTLIDWEAKKIVDESISFTAEDFEYIDTIGVQ